ncbi:MAG: UDP-N-acetylglucosamine 1-carboxyvinyltransferase [Candidatus Borkfalkiaceae bacterium]|nr:UDP-N-acetylglucosamine 1-carboxyvinyltransferase [Clostridia bacterium]MDY6223420.1 UDP-N-acetylglucosamine 1-carboxyvinyltransferase [Christensenellaceae bacterium]
MDKFIVQGGLKLFGAAEIQAAKNAVLPLLAASVLTDEKVILHNVPSISDVENMLHILSELGCVITRAQGSVIIDGKNAVSHELPASLTRELRSSVFMLGSVLTRFHRAKISYPGGCDIGLRPIDLHLSGLKRLGVTIIEENGYVICSADKIRGADILLDFPSVGATENIMLAAVKAEGETVIRNAAKEPEIADLQNFLLSMGAKVKGAGSGTVIIEGVKALHGVEYTPIRDRIEAGTFLIAAACCGGEIETRGVTEENIAALLHKLRENGCKITVKGDKIRLQSSGRLKSASLVQTLPFPGFPTDLQAQYTALSATARGTTVVEENLFETRYKYAGELKKMGADVTVRGRTAVIRGVDKLHGASVTASDLRGGAALVIAALNAEGESNVFDLSHIDRGYALFSEKLSGLGARIRRVKA